MALDGRNPTGIIHNSDGSTTRFYQNSQGIIFGESSTTAYHSTGNYSTSYGYDTTGPNIILRTLATIFFILVGIVVLIFFGLPILGALYIGG